MINKQIQKLISRIDNDEDCMRDIFKTLLYEIIEIRQILRKKKVKVYKRPTNNENDIIVGR